jgi:ubiquinone/menaquinone biosynthesis C-methylase UbiE
MTLRAYIISQFRHPRGPVGAIVGWLMAIKNRPRNAWLVELVDPQPQDRILEIGFGPGATLAVLARRAADGYVAGVDHSDTMVRQAQRRNKAAAANGRIDIRLGSAASLPFADGTFDKVCASNAHLFPDDEGVALREINRVLRLGGSITIALQPRWAKSEEEIKAIASELEDHLRTAGFVTAGVQRKVMRPVVCLGVIGRKGGTKSD